MSLIFLLLSKSTYGRTSTIHKALINVTSKLVSIKGKCCVLNHSFFRLQNSAVPWRLCCPFGKMEFLFFHFFIDWEMPSVWHTVKQNESDVRVQETRSPRPRLDLAFIKRNLHRKKKNCFHRNELFSSTQKLLYYDITQYHLHSL